MPQDNHQVKTPSERQEHRGFFRGRSRWDLAISLLIVIVVISMAGLAAHLYTTPRPEDRFTDFFMLNVDGKADDYPKNVSVGQPVTVILGITNHEYSDTAYLVDAVSGNSTLLEIGPVSLATGATWQDRETFRMSAPGDNQEVRFFLYKGNDSNEYHELHLNLNVRE
jgi:uncharacterized membrane protein